jgi:hypothetical protein
MCEWECQECESTSSRIGVQDRVEAKHKHMDTLTLSHFFCTMHCTFVRELMHSLMISHDKHACTLAKRLAYFASHNDTHAHSRLYLHTNIVLLTMTYQVCEHACIYMCTHLEISLMLHTFSFHTYTCLHTLAYCIHKRTQMHLINGSMFATWTVICIFIL